MIYPSPVGNESRRKRAAKCQQSSWTRSLLVLSILFVRFQKLRYEALRQIGQITRPQQAHGAALEEKRLEERTT